MVFGISCDRRHRIAFHIRFCEKIFVVFAKKKEFFDFQKTRKKSVLCQNFNFNQKTKCGRIKYSTRSFCGEKDISNVGAGVFGQV